MGANMRKGKKPGSGLCSYCGRKHPRGKNAKRKARSKGWVRCSQVASQRKLKKSEKGDGRWES